MAEGAWDEATGYLAECDCIVRSSADRNAHGEVASVLAERDLLAGHPEVARARLTPLLGSGGLGDKSATYLGLRLAWALLDLGEVEQAAVLVDQALNLARTREQRLYMADALRVQACVFMRQQRWNDAMRALREGLSLTRSMRYPYAEARLHCVSGNLSLQMSNTATAQNHLQEALAIFRRLGAHRDAERVAQAIRDLSVQTQANVQPLPQKR